jgi:gas vesicle protein
MSKKERNIAMGAAAGVAGVAAGYLAGILTAKKSGKETRQDIANATIKAKKTAETKIKALHTTLSEMLKEGNSLLKDTKSSAKEGFAKALENAKKAQESTREVLSAIHEGDADDKDLDKAISEANSAIEHLKTYLKK